MNGGTFLRRLRGVAGNAVVWGAGWLVLGMAAFGAFQLTGLGPQASFLDALGMSIRIGVVGGLAGGVFATALALLHRGRRLSQLSALRFGIGGGVLTGLFIPAFLSTMRLLSGEGPIPLRYVTDDIVIGLVFGGIVAGGTLKLAQLAERRRAAAPDHDDGDDDGGAPGRLPSGAPDPLDALRGRPREGARR